MKRLFHQDIDETNLIKYSKASSKAGINSDGSESINQDTFMSRQFICGLKNLSLHGVFDGHGNFI